MLKDQKSDMQTAYLSISAYVACQLLSLMLCFPTAHWPILTLND